ncbi:MAG: threonine/serine exporter family protein [Muribaculaceae bacterium]|nr:threonine/serine exporter family protein [Muribaculaceae bacterium]
MTQTLSNPSCGASPQLVRLIDFIVDYTHSLIASGVHTSRVIRNAVRIADSQNTDLNMMVTLHCLIITLRHENTPEVITRVVSIKAKPISFQLNTELSALSWAAIDERLSFEEIKSRYYQILSKPKRPDWIVLILLSLANGAFCRLFEGDWTATAIVILATAIGFALKLWLGAHKVNTYFMVTLSAFAASMTASMSLLADCTWQIALATSPLFLVPGVPLITCVIDAVEGHVLTAVSRFANAILIVLCISVGLGITLLIVTKDLPVTP